MRALDFKQVRDSVYALLKLPVDTRHPDRLLANRFFRGKVTGVQQVGTRYFVTLQRTGEPGSDGGLYPCVSGYTPAVNDDVECFWRDENRAWVLFAVNSNRIDGTSPNPVDSIQVGPSGIPISGAVEFDTGTGMTITQAGQVISFASSGGGSSSRPYLDLGPGLDATYGDDFTGASLNGRWTRHGMPATETFQDGGGSWMSYLPTAQGQFYLQAAPAGDFTIVLAGSLAGSPTCGMNLSPIIIDSSGNGVGCAEYSGQGFGTFNLSAYGWSSWGNALVGGPSGEYQSSLMKVWMQLRKVGTSYSARYSFNGFIWSPYTTAITWAGTPASIGFGNAYSVVCLIASVDVFNKV